MHKPNTEFRFSALWFDEGIRHPKLLGAFNRSGALITVRMADGSCVWERHCDETPDGFERRVTCDLRNLMDLAQRPSIDSQQPTQAAE
jgi:hypothetical protein